MQLRKGTDQATKTLNSSISECITMATDAELLEVIQPLVPLCEEQNVPYWFLQAGAGAGLLFHHQRRLSAETADPGHPAWILTAIAVHHIICVSL